jgi:hypothetical protein
VFELVKNAYDADASHVDVLLRNLDEEDASIIVSDDGEGMALQNMSNLSSSPIGNPWTHYGVRRSPTSAGFAEDRARGKTYVTTSRQMKPPSAMDEGIRCGGDENDRDKNVSGA